MLWTTSLSLLAAASATNGTLAGLLTIGNLAEYSITNMPVRPAGSDTLEMSDDLTPKQEAFARAYVETGNASEAYRQAYDVGEGTKPESVWTNASQTLANTKVAQRVMELQQEARDRTMVTVESLTKELDEDRVLARSEGQAAAAISAVMGKAKLHGLIVDKGEQKIKLIPHEDMLDALR